MAKGSNHETYELNDKPPIGRGVVLGFQHVLTMFTGNLAVAMIICSACGFSTSDTALVLQCVLFASGVTTIV